MTIAFMYVTWLIANWEKLRWEWEITEKEEVKDQGSNIAYLYANEKKIWYTKNMIYYNWGEFWICNYLVDIFLSYDFAKLISFGQKLL